MDHIHNETVQAFQEEHKDNPNIKIFLKEQDAKIQELDKELGENFKTYLGYLEANIGDDASFIMGELHELLEPI